eukprot:4799627-Lingulodinium_polyedra.AAC.1
MLSATTCAARARVLQQHMDVLESQAPQVARAGALGRTHRLDELPLVLGRRLVLAPGDPAR